MADVRAEEESLVQRMKLSEGDEGEKEIQRKLDEIFKKSSPEGAMRDANGLQANSLPSLLMPSSKVTLE